MRIFYLILLVLSMSLVGCSNNAIEINEDPLVTPYSIGPNSMPNVNPPTTNPPINE